MSIKNIENEYNKKLARKDEEITEKDNKIQALREEIYESEKKDRNQIMEKIIK